MTLSYPGPGNRMDTITLKDENIPFSAISICRENLEDYGGPRKRIVLRGKSSGRKGKRLSSGTTSCGGQGGVDCDSRRNSAAQRQVPAPRVQMPSA